MAAVRIVRGQLFDPAYIVFLQNYYEQVPFFTVSWSLCVEEHFYLLMPLAGAAVVVFLNPSTRWIAWVILLSVSPLCRWYEWRPGEAWTWFGYAETATHLRLDGLVLGVGLSYMSNFSRAMFVRLSAAAVPTIAASVAGLVMLELSGDGITKYVLWPALVAAACGGFVVLAGGWQEKAGDRLWSAIAISAYSTYLTHPLALHVAARVATPPEYRFAYLPLALALIFAGSRVTYLCIERPSLWLRDRLIGPSIVGRDRFAPDPPPYRSQC
jgi:peptidoglycan/LPS O-acetylase OafA/YrhL